MHKKQFKCKIILFTEFNFIQNNMKTNDQ